MVPSDSGTPEERGRRLHQEEEAKRVSNAIDEELNRERKAPKPVKILLLGEA
jgi:guanine nucleotide-binding protein subunit alpha